jgi:hypothetical protein
VPLTEIHQGDFSPLFRYTLAIMLLWGIYIASLCADMADPRSRPFEPAETFDGPVPYITEKGLQEVQAIHWDNWLTTDQWWTFEGMGDWETENRYYRLRFPWLADDLVDGEGGGEHPGLSEGGTAHQCEDHEEYDSGGGFTHRGSLREKRGRLIAIAKAFAITACRMRCQDVCGLRECVQYRG